MTTTRIRPFAVAALALSLAASLPAQITSSGSSDGAAGDSRIVVPASTGSTIQLTNSSTYTYTNFVSANGGAASAATGATLTFAADAGSLFIFTSNTATSGGGAMMVDTGATLNITNALFMGNQGAFAGAIFSSSAATTTVNLTNVSFIKNASTSAVAANFAGGGAIWMGNNTLNLNVTAGNSSIFAGNTAGGVSNSIHFANNTAGAPQLNVNVEAGASLDMLDPMSGRLGNAATVILTVTQTGGGVWNLGGANVLNPNATNGSVAFTVTSGTFHLYRVNESVDAPDGVTYKAVAGSLALTAASTAATKSFFTLNGGATLSAGGGNTISANGSINLLAGSILSFDIAGAVKEGLSTATSLLTLAAGANYNILNGNLLNSTINFETCASGSFNLLTAGAQLTTALNTAGLLYTAPADWTPTFSITGNSLWVTLAYSGAIANNLLTWTGLTSPNWLADANWTSPTVQTFSQQDVVNFDGTPTPNTTVALATTATASGMFISGPLSYTMTGAGITTDNTGVLGLATANGKLTLGAKGTDTAIDTTTPFTGTLTLANAAANNFTNGIDINSGVLRFSNTAQLGAPLSKINLLSDAASAAPATLQIAAGATITFDSGNATTNRLAISASKSADFIIEDNATLTFTNNSAGAITLAAGSTLGITTGANTQLNFTDNTAATGGAISATGTNTRATLTAGAGSQITFTGNNATADGGAIAATTGATLTLTGTAGGANGGAFLFDSNTTNNRGAIYAQTNATINIDNATFTNNTNQATNNGGAIGIITTSTLNATNVVFTTNTAGGSGGAIFNNTGAQTTIQTATFTGNHAGANGGAIAIQAAAANPSALTLRDFTLTDNTAATNGGAIYTGTNAAITLNLNVSSGSASLIAGNQAGATPAPNGIYFGGATATTALNVTIATGGALDMLDPMLAADSAGPLTITQNGSGTWNLGGASTLGATTANAAATFTVNAGSTLHLYRTGEKDTTTTRTAAAGNLAIAGAASAFTLANAATLSIGGGNTLAAPDGAINLAPNSTLALDLAAFAADPAITSLLTLNSPAIAGNGWTQSLDLLNLPALSIASGDTVNLVTLLGDATFGADATTFHLLTDLAGTGYTLQLNAPNGNILQLYYLATTLTANNVLTWAGATASWTAPTNNWNAAALTGPLTGTAFTQADIINLTDSTIAPLITNPVTTTLNVDTTTTATIAGMYVSGNQSYTLTGTNIIATATVGTLTGSAAANGKLTLGAIAPDAAGTPLAATYTGTLTLDNGANNFTAGIDILSGALVGNDQTLGVGPSAGILNNGTLTFTQTTNATYAAPITGNGTLIKTGAATLTLTANNTFGGTTSVSSGALLLGTPAAALASSDINVNATGLLGGVGTAGGNVTVNSGGTLMAGLTHNDTTTTAPEILTIAGALTVNAGAALLFDLYGSGTNDLINAGSLALVGTGTIDISNAYTGTYTLINATSALNLSGGALAITKNGDALTGRVTGHSTADATNTKLLLEIGVTNTTNTWTGAAGANGNLWNTAAANWTNPIDTIFYNGDSVTFAPATSGSITVDTAVTTAGMTVDTASAYTFDGAAITTSTNATTLTAAGVGAAFGKLVKQGAGTLTLANTAGGATNTFEEGIDLQQGSLTGNADTLNTTRNGITTAASTTLTFDQAAAATYAANILGSGELVKQNLGNLTLTGTTTYTGPTTVAAGNLTLTATNQIAASATVTLLASATLNTGANPQTLNSLNGAGNIATTAGGNLTLISLMPGSVYSGTIDGAANLLIPIGAITFTGNNTNTGTTTISSAAVLTLGDGSGANGTVAGPINVAGFLYLNHGSANTTLANVITGTGLITKTTTDTGTLTLTGNSAAFTGATTIAAGALVIAPNATLLGQTTLAANTALAGSGTLGNLTTLGSATITIGDPNSATPQTLWLTGTLTLAGPTTLNYDLFATGTGDRINAAGGLVRTGTDTISITANSSLSGTYTLITAAGLTPTATTNLLGAPNSARSTSHFEQDGNNLNLIIATSNIAGLVWDGTAGATWQDNTANWKTDDGKFLNGDSVIFDDTRTGANLVNIAAAGVLATGMTLTTTTAGAYTFTGGAITTNTTMNSTATGALVNGALTLTASNAGLIILNNSTNAFANGIYILGGTLQGNADTLGTTAGITNNATLVLSQTTAATYSTAITGTGALIKTATGALTLDNAANTYTGGITIQQGALTLLNSGTATQGPIAIATAAQLRVTSTTAYAIAAPLAGSGLLAVDLGGGAFACAPATGSAGVPPAFTGTVSLANSTFTLAGDNTLALAAATLAIDAGNTTTIATGTQTTAGLAINGGLLTFSTTIPADTTAASLIKTNTLALASGTIQIAVPVAPALASTGASLFQQASGTGALDTLIKAATVTGAAANLKLIDENNTPVGATQTAPITQNTINIATGTYGYALVNTATTLDVNYRLTSLTLTGSAPLALAPVAGDTGIFTATISGTGNLAITTTLANVTLTAANNFTGTTTVTSGTLVAGANNALGANNTLVVGASLATPSAFALGANTQTLAALTTAANSTLDLGAGALTLANGGTISGALTGAGALNLTGGNLAITSANPAFAAATTIAPNATATLAALNSLGATGAITNNGLLTCDNADSGTLANPITGSGTLNLNGAGATTITRANTAYTGQTNIAPNASAILTDAAALGNTGTANIAGSLTLQPSGLQVFSLSAAGSGTLTLAATTATTTLTGNNTIATINALATNIVAATPNALASARLNMTDATIALAAPNSTLGAVTMNGASRLLFATPAPTATATLASLTAPAGATPTLAFRTNISTGASDTLKITTSAAGAFTIDIANTPDQPAPTADKKLNLIDTTTAASTATFALGKVTGTSFSGQMNALDITFDPLGGTLHITQGQALGPTGGAIVANATGAMPLTWFAELDTLAKRLGDLHISPREKPGLDLWTRAYTQRLNVNAKDTLVPFTETQYGAEVGADYGGHPAGANNSAALYAGAFLGLGSSLRNVNDANTNSGDTTSTYAGAYITIINPDGWYVDVVGKYNHFKNTFTALSDNGPMNAAYATNALGASVEAGKRIALTRHWYATPSAQVAVAQIDGSNYATTTGNPKSDLSITQASTSTRQLRAGALVGYQFITQDGRAIQPHAKLYAARQWTNGGTITVRGLQSNLPDQHGPYYSTIQGARLETGLGVNWQVLKPLQVYFDYDTAFARDYTKPYGLTFGLNYVW